MWPSRHLVKLKTSAAVPKTQGQLFSAPKHPQLTRFQATRRRPQFSNGSNCYVSVEQQLLQL